MPAQDNSVSRMFRFQPQAARQVNQTLGAAPMPRESNVPPSAITQIRAAENQDAPALAEAVSVKSYVPEAPAQSTFVRDDERTQAAADQLADRRSGNLLDRVRGLAGFSRHTTPVASQRRPVVMSEADSSEDQGRTRDKSSDEMSEIPAFLRNGNLQN
jgi:hypothetical protein